MKFKSFKNDAPDMCVKCEQHLALHGKDNECPAKYKLDTDIIHGWYVVYSWWTKDGHMYYSEDFVTLHPIQWQAKLREEHNGNNDMQIVFYKDEILSKKFAKDYFDWEEDDEA